MVLLEIGINYEIIGLLNSHEEAISWIEEQRGISYKDYLEDYEDSESNRDEWYSENEFRVRDVKHLGHL